MTKISQSITAKRCVYCGSAENVTDDHIPPKNIFPKPRPTNINLITVPACKKCNSSFSNDDEYFRLKLCISEHVGNHPDALANQNVIFRSLRKPEAKGLRKSFMGDLQRVQLRTRGGIYLGQTYIFDVDLKRIFSVIERIVRGLYYVETSTILSQEYEVDVHSDDTLKDESPELIEELRQKILTPLSEIPPKIIGNKTFMYRFHITEEEPIFSVWALTFYGQANFLSLTGPRREIG
ncbi:MAG: hypothetical protein HY867_01435 [Chloroflexi bacterium]|nr:hypothetical protein [Chloroflexota bacterium]